MPDAETLKRLLLIVAAVFLGANIFLCLMRAVLGPRHADRIAAFWTMSMNVILLAAILGVSSGESYIADICLAFGAVGFLCASVLAGSEEKS